MERLRYENKDSWISSAREACEVFADVVEACWFQIRNVGYGCYNNGDEVANANDDTSNIIDERRHAKLASPF